MGSNGLVKSMMMIGAAQAGNIILSILRVKVLAVLLGPAGVGLLGVYNNLRETAVIASSLGLTTSGVREIASAKGEEETLSRVRRVLFFALILQGMFAAVVIWSWRQPLAVWLLEDATQANSVGLVGIAVFVFLLSGSQMALLQGMRQIAEMARATFIGALGGSVAGIIGIWFLGMQGLIWFILAPPLVTVLAAVYYTRKLPRPKRASMTLLEIWRTWRTMVNLGAAFMFGGLLSTVSLLLVRGYLTRELGLDAAGQFAASWAISMTYIGFLLNAMMADYFPRLTEVIQNPEETNTLINDQLQLGLAIGGPFLLGLIATAPWFISLLYSPEFDGAVRLLQWQSVGNIFKLATWALGFVIVAAGRSGLFLLLQIAFNAVFIGLIWLAFPAFGLGATGLAFFLAYVASLLWDYMIVRYINGFVFQRLSIGLLGMHVGLAALVLLIAIQIPFWGGVIGVVISLLTGIIGGRVVVAKVSPEARFARQIARLYASIGWPIRSGRW